MSRPDTERRSTEHWTLKKEINIANILVTVGSIAAGMWWLFSLDSNMTLGDQVLLAEVALVKQDIVHLATRVDNNAARVGETTEYLRSIDAKLTELITKFSYVEGQRAGQ